MGMPVQRGGNPAQQASALLFCASFQDSPCLCAIYYKQHSEVAAWLVSAQAGEPGSPQGRAGPRPGLGNGHWSEQCWSPTWAGKSARGRPLRVRGGAGSVRVARPAARENAVLGRSRRRQESASVTPASRRPRCQPQTSSAPPPHRALRAGRPWVLYSAGSDPKPAFFPAWALKALAAATSSRF